MGSAEDIFGKNFLESGEELNLQASNEEVAEFAI